jgi:serine/threonine-protein kinase
MDCPACHQPNVDGARFCAKCGSLLPVSTEEVDPLINQVVGGRFRITGVLGEGGMGRVYYGEQQMGTSVRKVAVKVLLSQYAKDPQVVARFQRECGTVSELEHPNTIRFYDFGKTPTEDLYIAMELLSGQSLEEALEKGGPLPPERVDRIMGQVCGSLQEAHEKGIIHRDLKPANIFLTKRAGEDDYVKVLDFGIARRDERVSKSEQKLTQQGTVLGTPPYMSPEQFMGKQLDARSDIYSLGVVAYEMLTGRLPFDADTPWAWATQHMTAQPFPFEATQMGPAVPPKIKAAIMRALSKKPEDRQQTVKDFYEELTLGAGPRLSVLGAMPQTTSQIPSGGGGLPPARSGQTQIGEPIFASSPPAAPAGRTIVDGGAPTGSVAAHVPTTGAQVFPAPPPSAHKKGSGPLIAGAAVVGVLVLVGVVFLVTSGSGSGDEDKTIIVPSGSASAVNVAADPVGSAAPASSSSAATADTTKTPTTKSTGGSGTPGTSTGAKPAGDARAEEECRAAMNLAAGGHTALAVNHFQNCDGPSKGAARSAIDGSARRAVASKGCGARGDANAAAKIGLTGALQELRKRKCPGL